MRSSLPLAFTFAGLLLGIGCATSNQVSDSNLDKTEIAPIARALEYRDAIPENIELIRKKIYEFEQSANSRKCENIQFVGYDGKADEVAPKTVRVKASAMSSCGPSYYWFKKSENSGRIASIEINNRAPARGDKVLVHGRYGNWELSKKY